MDYRFDEISKAAITLKQQFESLKVKRQIVKSPLIKELFYKIKDIPPEKRGEYGTDVNNLKKEVEGWLAEIGEDDEKLKPIDITAPFDVNTAQKPKLLTSDNGSIHPLMSELDEILDIFYRMGFDVVESREIDDDYHMFESLNFPKDHPARDDWDTFMTLDGLIAPAHTSTMQNRVLKRYKKELENHKPIAVVMPGRTFRNEDLDAKHEHTFYQVEGVYVAKNVNTGHLIATLKTFLQEYYDQELEVKTQPFYFPFTEPSFEFALSCPFCQKKGCGTCGQEGWIELLGCGMIHPNVLNMAGIDPNIYTGFAWGVGIDRLVMMKNNIEDIRHFESGKLEFLRQL
jgi:phenylalanyl-tRNA synthetase alpha chain